jgi:hypothetical protein
VPSVGNGDSAANSQRVRFRHAKPELNDTNLKLRELRLNLLAIEFLIQPIRQAFRFPTFASGLLSPLRFCSAGLGVDFPDLDRVIGDLKIRMDGKLFTRI